MGNFHENNSIDVAKTDLGQIITGGPSGPRIADVGENSAHCEEGFLRRTKLQEGGAGTALMIKFYPDKNDDKNDDKILSYPP